MNSADAYDVIMGIVRDAWVGTYPDYPIVWTDLPGEVPADEVPWIRPSAHHVASSQSLAGATGTRRFTNRGVLTVQVFTPVGGGLLKGHQLSQVVVDGIRDARQAVWFRNTVAVEVESKGAFNQINVISNFTYDNVR